MKRLIPAVVVCLLALCACKHDIENKDAVRQGIMNYLSKRTDLGSMDVTVSSVSFRQNEAQATVHFQAKSSNAPGTGMDMSYVLERQGNEWVVKGKTGANAAHGNTGENPHGGGMMPGALPPGHPAVPAQPGSQAVPPGPGK